jgi:hypothetical protein
MNYDSKIHRLQADIIEALTLTTKAIDIRVDRVWTALLGVAVTMLILTIPIAIIYNKGLEHIDKSKEYIHSLNQEQAYQRELIDKAVKDLRDQLHHDKQVILELSRLIDDIEYTGAHLYTYAVACSKCHGGEE